MNTLKDVKDKLIDYLMSVDLAGLSTCDLTGYTGIICQLSGIEKPDYMDTFYKAMTGGHGFGKKPEKEETDNG